MERSQDQIGYLVLTKDGAVLSSGGELENDERVANIIMNLVCLTDKIDPKTLASDQGFEKISINFGDHCYDIYLSNKKIHVVKRLLTPALSTTNQSMIDV